MVVYNVLKVSFACENAFQGYNSYRIVKLIGQSPIGYVHPLSYTLVFVYKLSIPQIDQTESPPRLYSQFPDSSQHPH